MLDVLVERVVGAERAAGSRRTAARVALEADEEEPGFELAEALVDAIGEGVAAAQDPLAVVGRGRGEADVGVDAGSPARRPVSASRSSGSNSSLPPSGAPLYLWRPIVCSWSSSAERSQTSSSMRIRRRDQVAAAAHPGRPFAPRPRRSGPSPPVLGADVGGAVLEPHQVARRRPGCGWSSRCGRSRAATSASPPCRGRSGPGCGSRGRRPGGRRSRPGRRGRRRFRARSSSSPGSGGIGASAAGCCAAARAAAVEQARAEAEGDGQPRGQQADRLAGVIGRRELAPR